MERFLVYLCIGVKLLILDTLSTYTYEIDLKNLHLNTPFLLVLNNSMRGGVNNFMPFRTTTSFNILHFWGYVLKVQQLSHICVPTNLSPLECRKKWTKIYTIKYWFIRRFLAPKWTGSSTFGNAERPPEVARSAGGPRHRLGTLRRDVEKCLKTPCVWGIRKNFKNNVFLRTTPLRTPAWCP